MKDRKKLFRLFSMLLILALLAAGIFFVAAKAYSMYLTLCRKMDYACSTIYSVHELAKSTDKKLIYGNTSYSFDYGWIGQTPPLIAHAFGGVDGHDYTNSLEAFEHNYALGHRVFEVDFDLTDEYLMVASHDQGMWRMMSNAQEDIPYTYEAFMSMPLEGQYTPLDYRDVVDLMIRYPDIYIVTDTKYSDQTTVLLQFSQLVKYAEQTDVTVLDRIIPQIYHEDMLNWVMSVHPFKSVIFTLYAYGNLPQDAYSFCERSHIRFLTVPHSWITQESLALWDQLGITVAAHTVNDPSLAQSLKEMGVDILYTDTLIPADM